MSFEIVGEITGVEAIAVGPGIRMLPLFTKALRKRALEETKGARERSSA